MRIGHLRRPDRFYGESYFLCGKEWGLVWFANLAAKMGMRLCKNCQKKRAKTKRG